MTLMLVVPISLTVAPFWTVALCEVLPVADIEQETGTLMVMMSMMSVVGVGSEPELEAWADALEVVRIITDMQVKNNKTDNKHTLILRFLCMTIIIIL